MPGKTRIDTQPLPSRRERAHRRLATVSEKVVEGAQVTRVLHFPESGFVLLDVDAPDDPGDDYELVVICTDCLIEQHPEAGLGMDLAREHGEARLEGEAWVAVA